MAINLLLGVKDAVVGTVDGLIDGIKYVWNNPLQTIEGVNFFSRALHSGTEENDLLVQMIKESGKELSKEFIEGDADKKARMLGQAVGEVLLALVSTKGVTAAVDAIKAGIKSGELASWFSKFSKGTATAEDIANGLGKTAETVDKADDSVKIIGNIEGTANTAQKLSRESVVDKLDRYLLNPEHPVGGSKAKWFDEALGFNKSNMDDLANQIVFDPTKAVQTGVTEFGTKYNQVISVTGANGKTIDVTFAWIKNNDGVVRLVTGIPTQK